MKRERILFLTASIVLTVMELGCADRKPPDEPELLERVSPPSLPGDFAISLHRDGRYCEGTCPSFTIRLDGTGARIYEGHVPHSDSAKHPIDTAALVQLVTQLDRDGFFDLPDTLPDCEVIWTDSPSVLI